MRQRAKGLMPNTREKGIRYNYNYTMKKGIGYTLEKYISALSCYVRFYIINFYYYFFICDFAL